MSTADHSRAAEHYTDMADMAELAELRRRAACFDEMLAALIGMHEAAIAKAVQP